MPPPLVVGEALPSRDRVRRGRGRQPLQWADRAMNPQSKEQPYISGAALPLLSETDFASRTVHRQAVSQYLLLLNTYWREARRLYFRPGRRENGEVRARCREVSSRYKNV